MREATFYFHLSELTTIRILKTLLFTKAAIWLLFSIIAYSGSLIANHSPYRVVIFITSLMVVNGLCYLYFALRFPHLTRKMLLLAIIFISLNFILAFTDQIGWADIAVASFDLAILLLLIRTVRGFHPPKSNKA